MPPLMKANLEALTDNEATKVGTCYIKLQYGTTLEYTLFCDDRTSTYFIYPCPNIPHHGFRQDTATDRCTK